MNASSPGTGLRESVADDVTVKAADTMAAFVPDRSSVMLYAPGGTVGTVNDIDGIAPAEFDCSVS